MMPEGTDGADRSWGRERFGDIYINIRVRSSPGQIYSRTRSKNIRLYLILLDKRYGGVVGVAAVVLIDVSQTVRTTTDKISEPLTVCVNVL